MVIRVTADLQRKIVQLVPMTFFRLQAAGDAHLAARGLTTGLRGLLLSLEEHGATTAARLADMRPVSRQAVHKMAEQLLRRGLIRQVDNPDDGRAPLLALTQKGRAEVARLRADEVPSLTRLFEGLPQRSLEESVRVLEAVAARLAPTNRAGARRRKVS